MKITVRASLNLLLAFMVTTLLLAASDVYARRPNIAIGQITSGIILQERIHLTLGDKAITSLGMKDGVIKGDIFRITTSADLSLEKPIGECAVVRVDRDSSVCEIINANMEVERETRVSIAQIDTAAPKLFPAAYGLLFQSVDAYEPYERVSVYIHDIFDEQNNVTQLSDTIRQEIENVFAQKKRIQIIRDKSSRTEFHFYPSLDREQYETRHELMGTLGVDVFVAGSYTFDSEGVNLSLYKFDRRSGDETLTFKIPLTPGEMVQAKEATRLYVPAEKREYVTCTVAYHDFQYAPQKDEAREIIEREAHGDAFKAHDLRKTNFNLISPVDIVVRIDDKTVNFSGGKKVVPFLLTKGTHRVFASFKRGYFFNTQEPRLYVSDKPIDKEAFLSIEKDGTFLIEVAFHPSFDSENISFKVYSVNEKKSQILKTIVRTETSKSIEFFKD